MNHFRIDRLLTIYFFNPLLRILRILRTDNQRRIPILMYHSISNDDEGNIHPYYRINTSPEIFAEHIKFLHGNKYSVISLKEIKNYFYAAKETSSKYVVITFDDGYRDFYTGAFPILQKYGYTATVFLPTKFIDNKELKLKNKEHLNWNEVRELSDNGIHFGTHTVNHPKLINLNKKDVEFEISQSKAIIENKLGKSVYSFSYPFKFPEEKKAFTKYLSVLLEKNGYECGVSTRIGTTSIEDDIYFLKRIPVNTSDDILFFTAKLGGGYDWLFTLQYLAKHISINLKQK